MAVERQPRPSGRTSSRPRRRRLLAAALLVLPFAAVFLVGRVAVAPLATELARPFDLAAAKLDALPQKSEPVPLPPTPEAEAIARLDGTPTPPADAFAGAPTVGVRAGTTQAPAPIIGILVRRSRVKAAVQAGIRPSGYPVPETSWRPAGLSLVGVSALGVGLRDGDVLTRVAGTPARSDGAVIGAVRGALHSGARAISGDVWRGQRRMVVTVELPKVKRERAGPRRPSATQRRARSAQAPAARAPSQPVAQIASRQR